MLNIFQNLLKFLNTLSLSLIKYVRDGEFYFLFFI